MSRDNVFSSIESIRESMLGSSLKEEESNYSDVESRLTSPLKTAYRNVAQAAASIATLKPEQRKAACITLIDISTDAMRSVEKTLRRNGTADAVLLSKARKIIKQLEDFDKAFDTLSVNESVDGSLPEEFDSGDVDDEITALAYRVLKDNSDLEDPEMEDLPGDDLLPGEATDATVNVEKGEGADTVIDILANGEDSSSADISDNDTENESVCSKDKLVGGLPEQFPNTNAEKIHEGSETNMQIISNIFKNL